MINWDRDERGAVAPFVAILMVVLIGLASFAVDLGYQRVAARDMQAVADIVSLDMARELDGTKGTVLKNTAAWQAALTDSLARNNDRAVGDVLKPVPCGVSLGTLPHDKAVICATPGIYNPATKVFTDGGNAPATHARVVTRTRIDYFFPVFADDGWVTKIAYAEASGGGCIQLGSYAARLDTSKSPLLGGLLGALGTNVALSAADYNALAGANVGLLGLVNAPVGLVSMQEALSLPGVALGDFYLASANALQAQGGSTAAVSVLQALAVGVPGISVPLGEVLSLGTGGAAGLDSKLNILDLVTAAAAVAAGDRGLSIPSINLNLPVIGQARVTASAFEGMRPYCGRKGDANQPPARSAAATFTVDTTLLPVSIPLLASTSLKLGGEIKVASANAKISDIKCDPTRVRVKVADGIVDVKLWIELKATILAGGVKVFGRIPVTAAGTSAGEPEITILTDADFDKGWATAGEGSGLPALHADPMTLTATLLGLPVPLGPLLTGVLSPLLLLVNQLVDGLDDALIAPLLHSLGLDISGADLRILRVPRCDQVGLRG